jgi:hypothetical protein
MSPLIKYYENKTVCLIGGCLKSDKLPFNEDEIDTYVQINDHCKSNGKPVDVLYHACASDLGLPWSHSGIVCYNENSTTSKIALEYLIENNVQCIPYRKEAYKGKNSPYGENFNWLTNFMHDRQINPLSGIIALVDILRFNPKQVLVTGMNLYSNGESLPERRNEHTIKPHVEYLNYVLENHKNVIFDQVLLDALKLPIVKYNVQSEYQRLSNIIEKKSCCQLTITEVN